MEEGGPDFELIEELEEKTDRLESLERQLEEVGKGIAAKKRVKETVFSRQDEWPSAARLANLDTVAIDDMAEFAREAEEIRARLFAYGQLSTWLKTEDEKHADPDIIREGRRLLEDWLRGERLSADNSLTFRAGRVLSFINLVAAVSLALTVNPLFLILMVPAGGIFWLVGRKTGTSGLEVKSKERYLELGLEPPVQWDDASVRQLLRELSRQEVEAILARRKKDFLEAKEEELNSLENRKSELEKRKRELVDRYGVAPDIDEGKFYWLVERLNEWKKADEELEGLMGKRRVLNKRISELRAEIVPALESYGYSISDGSQEIRGRLRDLGQRKERYARADDRLSEAKSRKGEIEEQLDSLKKEKGSIYENLGLEVGDRAELNSCLEQLEDYRDVRAESRRQQAVCNSLLEVLKEREEFDRELLEFDVSELRQELKEAREKAEKKDAVFEKINRIEERIKVRKKERELEMARAELDRALDNLTGQLYSDFEQLSGNVLLSYLREEGLDKSRPGVLKRGREFFARITKGEYRLKLADESPPSFKALKTDSGEVLSLDQLSSGTRLQLLMAVRMGFVENQEKEFKLPLFLDEVLANSDDLKAAEIIDVALEFCREGRQIFYFTAQGGEVVKWRDRLDRAPEISGAFIDLSGIRGLDETIDVPDLASHDVYSAPPDPDGMDHGEYGEKLTVPKFNPHRDSGSTHLWYLVEDVELLYGLLELGVETWGQFKALFEENSAVLERFCEENLARVNDLGRVLEKYSRARCVGRNRPIDRDVLEESGAVTGNFIDEVLELVRDEDGDPEMVVRRLNEGAVSGFRTRKREELEEFLVDNGYISRKDELTEREIRTRLFVTLEGTKLDDRTRAVSRLIDRLSVS